MRLILSSAGGAVFGLLILTACSQASAARFEALEEPASAPCPAAEYQTLVGQLAGEVDMGSLPQPSLLLRDGETPAAVDLERMTLLVDADGRVAQVGCR